MRIVVTGGGRGIGRAVSVGAGVRGWRVAIGYARDRKAAETAAEAVRAAGGDALVEACEVTDPAQQAALFDAAGTAWGGIDGVFANAGIVAEKATLAEMEVERLRRMVEVNVLGTMLTLREAARRLGPGGAIVVNSSAAARLGAAGEYVDYAATKGALDTLTLGLARELGPRGIRVNAVRPGLIETDIHASGGQPDRAGRMGRQTPMGRPGTADEVAEAVLWLLSPQASYVTASHLEVAGGR